MTLAIGLRAGLTGGVFSVCCVGAVVLFVAGVTGVVVTGLVADEAGAVGVSVVTGAGC